MKKYVIDTNVWLNLSQSFKNKFDDGIIVVPLTVISELDHQKHQTLEKPNRAYMARQAIRELSEIWEISDDKIELYDNSNIKVPENIYSTKYSINDDLIIQTVKYLQSQNTEDEYILVTNDLAMRIKASTLGVNVFNIKFDTRKEYKGYKQIYLDDEIIDIMYKNKDIHISLSQIKEELVYNCFYEFVSNINFKKTILTFFNGETKKLEKVPDDYKMYGGIKPMNKEQKYYAYLLHKTDIPCIQVKGSAGSGKAQPLQSRLWKLENNIIIPSTIGEIQIGDYIICEDGKPYPVKNIYNRGIRDNYKVIFEDGTFTNCCDEHLWQCENEIVELKNMLNTDLSQYKIINLTNKPILFYNKFIDTKDFNFEKIVEMIINGIRDFSINCSNWYIHILKDIINEKIIFNYDFREQLLKTLFKYHNVFNSFNPVKIKDTIYRQSIIRIAKSTGYYVDLAQDNETVFISKNREYSTIKNIIKEESTEMKCIEVDSPKHCYVTDCFIVTHNTLMAISYAMNSIYDNKKFKKFVYIKTLDPVSGKDIGYLPGTKEEKIQPLLSPLYDSLEKLMDINRQEAEAQIQLLTLECKFEIETISHIRGRSFNNTLLIIDEAENLDISSIKTLLTRCDSECRILLLSDDAQIDNPKLSAISNGTALVKEKLVGQELFSFIELNTSVRSKFTDLVTKLMDE